MIIGEALKSIFSGLSLTIENRVHDVQFHYGDQKELQQWILHRNRSKLQKYPLIWYVTNSYDQITKDKFKVESQLILFQLTKREYLNTQRSKLTYLNSLNPLYDLVNKTLSRSPYISLMNNGKPIKSKDEPNYGVETNDPLLTSNDFAKKTAKGEKSITLDVVDAKVLRLNMIIKPYCATNVNPFLTNDTSGGGTDPEPPVDTCINFTGVNYTVSTLNPSLTNINFTGGNTIGTTNVKITHPSGFAAFQDLVGANRTLSYNFELGTTTVQWRRVCNGVAGAYSQDVREVTNLGTVRLALKDVATNLFKDVPYPVNVATVVVGTTETITDSGLTATTPEEFITHWNAVNSTIGTMTTYEIVPQVNPDGSPFTITFFDVDLNDLQKNPSAAWCYIN